MQNPASFDRIVSYFHALAEDPFSFSGRILQPYSQLIVSPNVFRSYTCPENCGACCMRCSLVWDRRPRGVYSKPTQFEVNGISVQWYQDTQGDNQGRFCQHLDLSGRCGIYASRPLPCRFELFKFLHFTSQDICRAMVRLPGRGWCLTRVTGEVGAMCEITKYDSDLTKGHISDLQTIGKWMDTFHISNSVNAVIDYLGTGPHSNPLVLLRK